MSRVSHAHIHVQCDLGLACTHHEDDGRTQTWASSTEWTAWQLYTLPYDLSSMLRTASVTSSSLFCPAAAVRAQCPHLSLSTVLQHLKPLPLTVADKLALALLARLARTLSYPSLRNTRQIAIPDQALTMPELSPESRGCYCSIQMAASRLLHKL